MGSVNISLGNGNLGGTVQTNDGVVGMVLTGQIDDGGYALGTPVLLTSLSGLGEAGITAAGNPFAYRHIRDFYSEAGSGAQLYVMLVANTLTIDMICDVTNADGAAKLVEYANGKIKVISAMTDDTAVGPPDIEEGINALIPDAIVKLQALCKIYFGLRKPLRGIIGATSFTGVAADLADLTARTENCVGVLLGGNYVSGDEDGINESALGLLMGRVASIPVQRKVSRVKSGALAATQAYAGDTTVEEMGGDIAVIAERGYITIMTYPNITGYFFGGDPMCVPATDDYCMLARGRVIDKAHVLAYTTFIQEVDDEVEIDADTGTMSAAYCATLESKIENVINTVMKANKEIAGVDCFIDPAQNVLSSNEVDVALSITPVGYSTTIDIVLGFENPALSA
jgi:hypothetical protein